VRQETLRLKVKVQPMVTIKPAVDEMIKFKRGNDGVLTGIIRYKNAIPFHSFEAEG
jgi:hypothetical protein